jgi:hypothetical protein
MKTLALAVGLALVALPGCSDDEGSSASGSGGGGGGSSTSQATTASGPTTGPGGDGGSDGSGGDASSTTGTTGNTTSASSTGSGGSGSGGGAPSSIEGYWVWTRQIEGGQTTLEITDADMEGKVGPSGWEGCPEGILCTHHGIHKVAFGGNGRFHQQHNVFTSSDFQTLGAWSDGGDDLGGFERQAQFSCAHPEEVNADVVAGAFDYRLEDGELWIAVSGFFGFAFADVEGEPTSWIVYKPVTRDDYYGKYMIRVCQEHDGFMCHEGCFDASLVDEP